MAILRSVLGVLAGVIVGGGLVAAIEAFGGALYPPPPGLDPKDAAAFGEHLATLPVGAFLIVVAAHLVGPLVGAWLAARIAGRRPMLHAIVTGAVFLFFGIVNLIVIPHPLWFAALDVLMYPLAAWIAGTLARKALESSPS